MKLWISLLYGLVLCVADAFSAEVPATAPVYTLVHIKLTPDEGASVMLSSPLTPVMSAKTSDGLVFTGPPGRYIIGVSNFATKDFQFHATEIVGTGPTPPVPPGPVPPGPQPVPPPPDNTIPDAYKVGRAAYDAAVAVADPAGASVLSDIYLSAASRFSALTSTNHIRDFNTTVDWIHSQTDSRVANYQRWEQWRKNVAAAIQASYDAGNRSKAEMTSMLEEIGQAMGKVR